MDKETLSNYGWIVICVLVLAVMIALASPFGNFIANAVKSTTAGLFGVNQEALGAAGIVIDDQSFADTNGGGATESLPAGWAELVAASNDGTYATEYAVGTEVTLTLKDGTEAVFVVVAHNQDKLTGSSDTANMTLISKNVLTKHNMNDTNTNVGGWEVSEMRTYINSDFKDTYIPDEVLSSIKAVDKQTYTYGGTNTQTTSDKLWIPSYSEVGFTIDTDVIDAEGGSAYAYFTSDASRRKTNLSGTSTWWWLRSASSTSFHCVFDSGNANDDNANYALGVVLGFCI